MIIKNSLPALALSFFIIISAGCNQHANKRELGNFPEDSVINRDQMINILVDLHLLEAGLQLQKNRGIKNDSVEGIYYKGLFGKYHVSEKRFKYNLSYYQQDKDDFYKVYEEVTDRLDKLKIPKTLPERKK